MQNTIDKNLQRKVQSLLGWDQQEYADFIYKGGLAYLERYIPAYPLVVAQISKSLVFWNWWKMHWEKRELQFMEQVYGLEENRDEMLEIYNDLHDARSLAAAVYLNGQVLQESYAEMIGTITKAQTKHGYQEKEVLV